MPLNVLSTPIPFGIRNGIIWTPVSILNGFNKNKTQHQTLLSTKTNQGRIYFIRPKNMSQISDIAAVNHVTQAVIRVGSKIEP